MGQTFVAKSDRDLQNKEKKQGRRLIPVIVALLILQGSALALKGWEERQSADTAALQALQLRAQVVGEHLDGRVGAIKATLDNLFTPPESVPSLGTQMDGIDMVVLMSEAVNAPPGSRERIAAEQVLRAGELDGPMFTTEFGDIAILSNDGVNLPLIAIGSASEWLPQNVGERRFSLSGSGQLASGNPALKPVAAALNGSGPDIITSDSAPRAAASCAPMQSYSGSICAMAPRPLISINDITRMLIYLLLMLAPALAIYGLYAMLSGQAKEVEDALATERESADMIDLIMDGAQAGFWEMSADTSMVKLSDQFAALLGARGTTELTLPALLQLVFVDDRDMMQNAIARAHEIKTLRTQFRTQHDSGQTWVEMSGRQVQHGTESAERFAGIASDFTERKRVDDRLRKTERRLRNALEGYDGPFAIWDQRKRLLYWNGAYANTFNVAKALRAGMGYDTVALARAPSVRQETPSPTEPNTALVHLTNGRWVKLVERATPEGGLITVGVDVTDTTQASNQLNRQKVKLKRLVAELEKSEGHAAELARKYSEEKDRAERAAQSKSAFLTNMSHELRTPLNAINGFSEILATELYGPLGDERYKGYASDILMSGQHLLDMINDILDMAKIEAGKMSIELLPIDPVDPVDAAVRMIQRKAEDENITLTFEAESGLPEIAADHRAIRQMALNLLSNAIKFTDEGGRIAVTLTRRDDYLRYAFTDNGIGIPKEDLPRLAQPFEQVSSSSDRNHEGTGLGLALTKSFAEMHGGKLSIASQEGRGTTIAFYLPINGQAKATVTRDHDTSPKPTPSVDSTLFGT
jgi:two-component system cell cycle sensor histidine kinase PleC